MSPYLQHQAHLLGTLHQIRIDNLHVHMGVSVLSISALDSSHHCIEHLLMSCVRMQYARGQTRATRHIDRVEGRYAYLKLLRESMRFSCSSDWASASVCAALRKAVCRGAAFWTKVSGSSESSSAHTKLMLFLRGIPATHEFVSQLRLCMAGAACLAEMELRQQCRSWK